MAVIITEFQLDEFHGGNPLRVLDLGNGLNVALVRDAPGRFQMLRMIPWILYGPGDYFAAGQRSITAPGNRGRVSIRSDHGVFQIERDWSEGAEELPKLSAADGQYYEADYLHNILEGLPAENYQEIFSFDLMRLHRFAQGGAHAAGHLMSMADFLKSHSPQSSHAAPITAPPPNLRAITTCVTDLTDLVHDSAEVDRNRRPGEPRRDRRNGNREKLRQQLKKFDSDLSAARAKWNQFQKETNRIHCASAIGRVQSQIRRVKREAKEARDQKAPTAQGVNKEAAARLEDKLTNVRSEIKELQAEAADLRRQVEELGDLRRTARLVPQMDALLIQEKSLVKEAAACEEIEDKIRDLESKLEAERMRPATAEPIARPHLLPEDTTAHARLDQMSERLRESQRELDIAKDRFERAQQANTLAETSLRQSSSLTAHPEDAVAIHEAQQRVRKLRDTLGLDDQLSRLGEEREDLTAELQQLYAEQMMPFQMMMILGIPFVIGVMMIIWGLAMTAPEPNWQLVILGFLAAVISSLIKISMDQSTRDLLAAKRERYARVHHQIEEIAGARETAAVQGVSLSRQLKDAEQDLAQLQSRFASRTPDLESTVGGYDAQLDTTRRQWELAQQRQVELAGQWRNLMLELGLSPNLDLTSARESLASRRETTTARPVQHDETSQWTFQLQHHKSDLRRRRDWLNIISGQLRQLLSELGYSGTVTNISDQIDVLRETLSDHKEKTQTRREHAKALKRLRDKIRRLKESGRRISEQRAKLDEEAKLNQQRIKAQLKIRQDHARNLDKQRTQLEQELADIRAQYHVTSQSGLEELAELSEDELTAQAENLQRNLDASHDQLLKLSEQRGRCRAELNALDEREPAQPESESRIPWEEILEMTDLIAQECERTQSTPQSIAPTSQTSYLYLDQASQYLQKLSNGQFWQIDYPNPNQLILTDHANRTLDLAEVRFEHYANIYFSLWLARIEAYADQGLSLPIIMEDPLEATDPQRKPVVATLLRDIAAKGHQLILVTSDSFNASIFAQLDVPIANLSDRETLGRPQDTPPEPASGDLQPLTTASPDATSPTATAPPMATGEPATPGPSDSHPQDDPQEPLFPPQP